MSKITQENKILKYCHGSQSIKVSLMIYVDFDIIVSKTRACWDNAEAS